MPVICLGHNHFTIVFKHNYFCHVGGAKVCREAAMLLCIHGDALYVCDGLLAAISWILKLELSTVPLCASRLD